MKKGIIVLLIAVLVAGFAFADGTAGDVTFTGSATISYDVDLDYKDHGINNDKAMSYSFTFSFNSAAGSSKGEGKVYAEIEGSAKLELVADEVGATGNLTPKATLAISKANIIAGDVTINILGPKGFYSFAEFYGSKDLDDEMIDRDDTLAEVGLANHGLTVTYKDYEASFAFYHHDEILGGLNNNLYFGLKTPAYKLVDGLTLQAGGNFYFNSVGDTKAIITGGGFKAAYAPEGAKYSANLAFDAEAILVDGELIILPIDISASAKYDFLTADVYFITLDRFDTDLINFLGARVKADKKVNDQLTVGGYAEVLLYIVAGETDPVLRFGANATYTAEKFTLTGSVSARIEKDAEGTFALTDGEYPPTDDGDFDPGLGIEVEVSSKAVINNATVGLKWADSDFAKVGDEFESLGRISAYITVEF